jgi:NAD(P)-dependent dehydrogenase (short-subunit alcohol dehydrogenase family)
MFMSVFGGFLLLGLATAAAAMTFCVLWLLTVLIRQMRTVPLHRDSVVVIGGGSRGLGLAIAQRFAARQPLRLVLAARGADHLAVARQELLATHPHLADDDILTIAADLSSPTECQRLIDETIARFGRIDVLINNAAIIDIGPAESMTLELFEQTMQINFFAALYTTWAALPQMRTQPLRHGRRGAIVNISSVGGKLAVPHMLPYSAAKFALTGFSEGLHAELRGKGVRVTTICPGLMRTGGEDHARIRGDVEAEQRWFRFAATTPGIAVTAEYAAGVIERAVRHNRTEVMITPQAWLGARFGGLFPAMLQWANALTNELLLPKAPRQ